MSILSSLLQDRFDHRNVKIATEEEEEMEDSMADLSSSDSQIPGSLCSISLPSEPPNVRNWFSSYVYQSPIVDTSDNFVDSVSDQSECRKDGFVQSKNQNIPGILDLLSVPSEPPDVRNWFSSYAYQSPILDTSDNCGDSVSEQIESRKDGVVSEAEKIYSNGFVLCTTQNVPGFLDSLSLPSEPPDIRNWFSSYVYESPALDDDLEIVRFKESECDDNDGSVMEENNRKEEGNLGKTRNGMNFEKEENLDGFIKIRSKDELFGVEKIHPSVLKKCNNSFLENKEKGQSISKACNKNGDEKTSAENNLSCERNFEQNLEEDASENINISPTKHDPRSCLKNEGLISKQVRNNDVSPNKSIHEKKFKQERNFISENEASMKSLTRGENDKENGFVSIKKNKCTQTQDMGHKGSVSFAVKTDAFEKRKVLSETTNFRYSDGLEVSGKWKCPQKSKPILQPLKQLRLERWIHRV